MKKYAVLFMALLLSACLTACTAGTGSTDSDPAPVTSASANTDSSALIPVTTSPNPNKASYTAKIVQLKGTSVMLSGTGDNASGNSLCRLSLENLTLADAQGHSLNIEDILPGMLVEVEYDGMIMETWPVQLGAPTSLHVISREDDMVGLYLSVLTELYEIDPALNDGISMIALDLTKVPNLSDSEKAGLIWIAGEDMGHPFPIAATYDELCEEGYIDEENLYFKEGILLQIEANPPNADGSFTFSAQKWRSGLGAYYFHDCTAVKEDGVWSYTIGTHMVS